VSFAGKSRKFICYIDRSGYMETSLEMRIGERFARTAAFKGISVNDGVVYRAGA